MNSRERVQAVINHKIPNCVPNGLGGCETEGLHVLSYYKLQELLGISDAPPKICTFMTNAVFETEMIAKMQGDIILLASPRMCKSAYRGDGVENLWKEQILWDKKFLVSVNDKFTHRDDGNIVWDTAGGSVCPKGGWFFDWLGTTDFFADFADVSPDDYNFAMDLPEKMLRNLEDTAKQIYNESELSVCLGETISDLQVQPGGTVASMILMKERPDIMKEILDKAVKASLSQLRQLDQAVGKYVDILSIAHDLGDNRSVLIGDNLWREIYKPAYSELFQNWKKITKMKINFHSCGSIYGILGDLAECGADIINPVQISAKNMSPEKLKSEFGDKLIFWGGAYDAQLFTPDTSYGEVYSGVAENIKTLKSNGGYIFSGVHNLSPDIPVQHLKATLDAWQDNKYY